MNASTSESAPSPRLELITIVETEELAAITALVRAEFKPDSTLRPLVTSGGYVQTWKHEVGAKATHIAVMSPANISTMAAIHEARALTAGEGIPSASVLFGCCGSVGAAEGTSDRLVSPVSDIGPIRGFVDSAVATTWGEVLGVTTKGRLTARNAPASWVEAVRTVRRSTEWIERLPITFLTFCLPPGHKDKTYRSMVTDRVYKIGPDASFSSMPMETLRAALKAQCATKKYRLRTLPEVAKRCDLVEMESLGFALAVNAPTSHVMAYRVATDSGADKNGRVFPAGACEAMKDELSRAVDKVRSVVPSDAEANLGLVERLDALVALIPTLDSGDLHQAHELFLAAEDLSAQVLATFAHWPVTFDHVVSIALATGAVPPQSLRIQGFASAAGASIEQLVSGWASTTLYAWDQAGGRDDRFNPLRCRCGQLHLSALSRGAVRREVIMNLIREELPAEEGNHATAIAGGVASVLPVTLIEDAGGRDLCDIVFDPRGLVALLRHALARARLSRRVDLESLAARIGAYLIDELRGEFVNTPVATTAHGAVYHARFKRVLGEVLKAERARASEMDALRSAGPESVEQRRKALPLTPGASRYLAKVVAELTGAGVVGESEARNVGDRPTGLFKEVLSLLMERPTGDSIFEEPGDLTVVKMALSQSRVRREELRATLAVPLLDDFRMDPTAGFAAKWLLGWYARGENPDILTGALNLAAIWGTLPSGLSGRLAESLLVQARRAQESSVHELAGFRSWVQEVAGRSELAKNLMTVWADSRDVSLVHVRKVVSVLEETNAR